MTARTWLRTGRFEVEGKEFRLGKESWGLEREIYIKGERVHFRRFWIREEGRGFMKSPQLISEV
jgi:hypothetical protein